MKVNYFKLLVVVAMAVFILPSGIVRAQIIDGGNAIDTAKIGESVYDTLNPFSAGPSACGVSGEGLCQSSCGPYDSINPDPKYCSQKEQCCIPTKCAYSDAGIGECKNASSCGGEGTIGKNTSDCPPPKLCCVSPKITEVTCTGGVCTEDNNLNNSLASVCSGDFKSDFCDEYNANCSKDPNSFMCQQALLNLTNNATVSACAKNPLLAECLKGTVACSADPNSSDCLQFKNPGSTGLVPCTGFDCTLCSVFELIKRVIDWLVGFTLAISVGFIVWAGIQMMFSGGDSGAVSKARETATTAVYGVALALGGWLIIGTLLGALTGSDKIMPWNKITCTAAPIDLGNFSVDRLEFDPVAADKSMRDRLATANITVNKSACPAGTPYQNVSGGCTSVAGLQETAITTVTQLKQVCNCPIMITAGTELGHEAGTYSHANGYKIDLAKNSALDKYITSNYKSIGKRSGDNASQYQSSTGAIFADESGHWDMLAPAK